MRRLGQVVLTVGVLTLAGGFTLPFPIGVPKNDGIALALIGLIVRRQGPTASDFPPGTEFFIKEFDVPLALVPGEGWFNSPPASCGASRHERLLQSTTKRRVLRNDAGLVWRWRPCTRDRL